MLSTSPWSTFELTTPVVIGTDCIGSCKSNYHTITTAPDNGIGILILIIDELRNKKLDVYKICQFIDKW